MSGLPAALCLALLVPTTACNPPAAESARGAADAGPLTPRGVFPGNVSTPRIMIVGDSISAGPGCYKKYLLQELHDHHLSHFEFVGEYNDDCGGSVRHSAVSCSTAEHYTQPSFTMHNCFQGQSFLGLSSLMPKHRPDLVMLQLGVNDVWQGKPTQQILGSHTKLVEQARAYNPHVVLAVAQIQKIRPDCSTDNGVYERAEALVSAVPEWARKLSTPASPIFVADLWTNSDFSKAETTDCVHPNDAGAQRMAHNWFQALRALLPVD